MFKLAEERSRQDSMLFNCTEPIVGSLVLSYPLLPTIGMMKGVGLPKNEQFSCSRFINDQFFKTSFLNKRSLKCLNIGFSSLFPNFSVIGVLLKPRYLLLANIITLLPNPSDKAFTGFRYRLPRVNPASLFSIDG